MNDEGDLNDPGNIAVDLLLFSPHSSFITHHSFSLDFPSISFLLPTNFFEEPKFLGVQNPFYKKWTASTPYKGIGIDKTVGMKKKLA